MKKVLCVILLISTMAACGPTEEEILMQKALDNLEETNEWARQLTIEIREKQLVTIANIEELGQWMDSFILNAESPEYVAEQQSNIKSIDDLAVLILEIEGPDFEIATTDGWGRRIIFENLPGTGYRLISYGGDGIKRPLSDDSFARDYIFDSGEWEHRPATVTVDQE